MTSGRFRASAISLLAVALMTIGATTAAGSSASGRINGPAIGDTPATIIVYEADSGERLDATITIVDGRFQIKESPFGPAIEPVAPHCQADQSDPTQRTVTCDLLDDGIAVIGNEGNDQVSATSDGTRLVTLSGDAGNDTLRAGSRAQLSGDDGHDVLEGSPAGDVIDGADGNDTIRARDGQPDEIFCGAGRDTVEVDASDFSRNAEDCEGGALLRPTVADVSPVRLDRRRRLLRFAVLLNKRDCSGTLTLVRMRGIFGPSYRFRGAQPVAVAIRASERLPIARIRIRLTRRQIRGVIRAATPNGILYSRVELTDSVGHRTTGTLRATAHF